MSDSAWNSAVLQAMLQSGTGTLFCDRPVFCICGNYFFPIVKDCFFEVIVKFAIFRKSLLNTTVFGFFNVTHHGNRLLYHKSVMPSVPYSTFTRSVVTIKKSINGFPFSLLYEHGASLAGAPLLKLDLFKGGVVFWPSGKHGLDSGLDPGPDSGLDFGLDLDWTLDFIERS